MRSGRTIHAGTRLFVYTPHMKKLRRKREEAVFAGILAGLGEYFEIDPIVLRVFFLFFVLVTGVFPGIIAYFIAILIIPAGDKPTVRTVPADDDSYNARDDKKD